MSVRSRLAGDLESQYDKVVAALEEAMESTKKAWGFCPKCRTKVQVDFPDHGARIKAVELWLEQGFGRPGRAWRWSRPRRSARARRWTSLRR